MIGLYDKILVPLDGSTLAEQVLPHLQRLATPTDTTFVLVNVINSANYVATHSRYLPPDYFTRLRASAEAYLAEQQRPLEEAGFRVEAYVGDGDAAGTILQLAATVQADLIAMTTHGHSGFVRWALGSVAERIVSETALPVFLVREATALPGDKLHRILVPLDGSALAEQALPTAGAQGCPGQQKICRRLGQHEANTEQADSYSNAERKDVAFHRVPTVVIAALPIQ